MGLLLYRATLYTFGIVRRFRTVVAYKDYTTNFLDKQPQKVRDKYIWTIQLIEEIVIVPTTYLKHLQEGIYEVRIKQGTNIFRVMSFFENDKLILTINGFRKKGRKTPKSEIERAKRIRKKYEKEQSEYQND